MYWLSASLYFNTFVYNHTETSKYIFQSKLFLSVDKTPTYCQVTILVTSGCDWAMRDAAISKVQGILSPRLCETMDDSSREGLPAVVSSCRNISWGVHRIVLVARVEIKSYNWSTVSCGSRIFIVCQVFVYF